MHCLVHQRGSSINRSEGRQPGKVQAHHTHKLTPNIERVRASLPVRLTEGVAVVAAVDFGKQLIELPLCGYDGQSRSLKQASVHPSHS